MHPIVFSWPSRAEAEGLRNLKEPFVHQPSYVLETFDLKILFYSMTGNFLIYPVCDLTKQDKDKIVIKVTCSLQVMVYILKF